MDGNYIKSEWRGIAIWIKKQNIQYIIFDVETFKERPEK
jgi:hypothetical protein